MLRRTPEAVPSTRMSVPRFKNRLLFEYQRLALSWHAMRYGRGRSVSLRREGDLVRVDDGVRQIFAPHARRAPDFRDGIGLWIEKVAEKYVGGTGYAPREGDTVVDIGAGIGAFSLWCADSGARIVAFEPDPLAFACLERNMEAVPGARIFSCALWKERTHLRLHGTIDTSGSSLIEDGRSNARSADVEAWPLDELPAIQRLPVIDFMKLDGEGVEPEILAGGAKALRRTRILAIDVGAGGRRPGLRARVEAALHTLNFRPLPREGAETILALNTAMVGPINNRVLDRRGS